MNFDDIKEKLLEVFQQIQGKISESPAYIQLREKYDSLNPNAQKAVLAGTSLAVLFLILMIPMSYYSSGTDSLSLFEENRDIVLDLYRAKRRLTLAPAVIPPIDAIDLETRARNAISAAKLLPEQSTISGYDNKTAASSSGIPKSVDQKGVAIQLSNINISQLVDLSHAFVNLSPSAKIVALEVKAGTQPGSYFDALFKIVSFSIPGALQAEVPAKTGGKKK